MRGEFMPRNKTKPELQTELEQAQANIYKLEQELTALRKAAENECLHTRVKLQESEDRFANVFHANPSAQAIVSMENGKIMDVNLSFCRQTGYSYHELIGHTMRELNIWGDQNSQTWVIEELRSKGYVHNVELDFQIKTGEIRSLLISFELMVIAGVQCVLSAGLDITERKRAEEEKKNAAIGYRALFNQTHDAIFILDFNGVHIDANQRAADMMGYSIDEMRGLSMRDLSAEIPQSYNVLQRLLNGENIPVYERHFRKKSGEIFPVEVNAELVRDANGRPLHIQSVIRDISERKHLEESLLQSEERYRIISSAVTDYAFSSRVKENGEFKMNWVAGAFEAITGYAFDEIMNDDEFRAMIHPDDVAIDDQAREYLLANRKSVHEMRIIAKSGEVVYLRAYIQPVWDEQKNKLAAFYGAVQNITEQKHLEEQRRESEKRLRLALDAANMGIWSFDMREKRFYWDERILNLFDAPPLTYTDLLRRIHPEDRHIIKEKLRESLGNPSTFYAEVRAILPGNSIRWFSIQGQSSSNYAGQTIVLRGVAFDIHERKAAEKAIHRYNQQLTTLVNIEYELASSLNEQVIGNKLGEGVQRIFPDIAGVFISRFDEERQMIKASYVQVDREVLDASKLPELPLAPDGQGTQSRVIRSRQPLVINSNLKSNFKTPELLGDEREPRSALYVPILTQEKVFGLIQLQSYEENRFTENDIRALSLIANAAAISFENANLFSDLQAEIHERRRAEEKLRDSEEQYRGLMESLASIVATVDVNGVFLYMNDMAADSLGGTASELVGKTLHDLFPPEYADRHLRAVQKVIRENKSMITENQSYLQGRLRWYRVSIQPIHDEAGSVVYTLLNITDIDAIKSAQQELKFLNEKLEERVRERTAQVQDLYDNAPVGYHSLDETGNLIAINQTELNWLGYTREELLGKPIAAILVSKGMELYQENFPKLKEQGRLNGLELEIRRKDGTVIPTLLNAFAVYDEAGRFIVSRSTLTDITKRKQVENAFKKANERLEHALRIKDEFLANMSHELRTPLNSILGFSEMMLSGDFGELNERQRKYTANIESSGNHLLGLINDLLDLSKIEAGMLEIYPEQTNIDEVCHASLAFVKQLAAKKNIHLSYRKELEFPFILADQRRLKQILVNLLSNAVKFTPEHGSVTLRVFMDAEKKFMNFSVQDTGIGIAEKDIPKLFMPFTQLDNSLARQYEGTGLGLSLVQELTELHNGRIHVQSMVGAGSTFTVSIPCEHENIPEPIQEKDMTTATPDLERSKPLAAKKLLLAEDVESNIMILGDFLNFHGYEMIYARNGREALEKAIETPPDLILMDVQMPVMDGLEATRRLRTDPRFTSVPIVALTALAMTGDRERCLEAGATEYVSKPVNLKQLEELIKKLLQD